MSIDIDGGLDVTDKENLQDMSMDLPSAVFKKRSFEETLESIKKENRSIGQLIGISSKLGEKEKEIYKSRKETLTRYKDIIDGLEGAKQFYNSSPKRTGKGSKTDVIYYPSVEDLCMQLTELDAAKQAGHTGLDNRINSILDELLRIKAIDKHYYGTLYKKIFKTI